MSNMSYCRFHNTYNDLLDCFSHWDSEELSNDELYAKNKLLTLVREIIQWEDGKSE